jgi:hypothetical protein
MEVLLIDIGALAVFLGYMAFVYWHGISHDSRGGRRERTECIRGRASRAPAVEVSQREGASARARSARSSVGIAQRTSQLMQ